MAPRRSAAQIAARGSSLYDRADNTKRGGAAPTARPRHQEVSPDAVSTLRAARAVLMAAPMVKTKYPGIYKRGSRYVVRYRVNGEHKSESARTLDEARRLQQARRTDIDRGEFHERSRVTFRAYADEWIDRYQGRGRRGF